MCSIIQDKGQFVQIAFVPVPGSDSGRAIKGADTVVLRLDPGEVVFVYTFTDQVLPTALREKYQGVITRAEAGRVARYRQERDRNNSLLTRALVRYVLGEITNISPESLEFEHSPHGKPILQAGQTPDSIHFNISHTRHLTCCAVSMDTPVGIDVESLHRKVNLAIAPRFFSKSEADLLEKLPEEQKKSVFLDLWTLKESFIKAKGKGLAMPLNQFSFNLEPKKISISFAESIGDDPEGFSFFRLFLPRDYQAAMTTLSRRSKENIKVYQCLPFHSLERKKDIIPA